MCCHRDDTRGTPARADSADLDRLVQRAIIPERARAVAQTPDSLRLEWDAFKTRWNR
jgi:hypothetical protein